MVDALSKLKTEGSQEAFIEEMMTRKELYEIIGYEDYEGIGGSIPNLPPIFYLFF